MGLEDGWIERRTGIRTRHWAEEGDTLSGLAAKAGEMAIDSARIARQEIALTLLATSTPDHLLRRPRRFWHIAWGSGTPG